MSFDLDVRIGKVLERIRVEGEEETRFDMIRDFSKYEPLTKTLYEFYVSVRESFSLPERAPEGCKLIAGRFLDVDERWREAGETEFVERLLEKCNRYMDRFRACRDYAYFTLIHRSNNYVVGYTSSNSSFGKLKKLEELMGLFRKSINDMMWESIQYVNYVIEKKLVLDVKNTVLDYYGKFRDLIEVVVHPDEVDVYCPPEIAGRVIGKQGRNVKSLENKLGRKVRVIPDESITRKFLEEMTNPDEEYLNPED